MARELAALGERPRADEGGVAWEGDARSLMRANLWLRTASRVLVRVASFRATAFHELERQARRVAWERYTSGRPAEFRVTARKSRLYHSDAIAERLTQATARTSGAGADGPPQLFVVRVVRDVFEVSADASGELLHMRGYRQETGKAPLRETLAAALLLAARWTGESPLLDPFCGSGTIPIEGAMIARGMPPGLARDFAFMHWPGHDARAWDALRDEARAAMTPRAGVVIRGSDRDEGAIAASRANAGRGSVADDVEFGVAPVSAIEPAGGAGLIACNPPYGKRVGDQDVRNLYARFGDVLRGGFGEWRVALYAPDAGLVTQTRLPLEPAIRTVNGGIRVVGWLGKVQVRS